MEFTHLLRPHRRILGRHFDARCHGPGRPFQVIGFTRLGLKPGPLILLLPGFIRGRPGGLDNSSVVHLGHPGDDHGSRRHLQERVFAVQEFGQVSAVDIKLVV